MTSGPVFPPLMQGINAAGADPFEAACSEAARGCDAGTILYDVTPERLQAAIVLAPEVALADAAAMLLGEQRQRGAVAARRRPIAVRIRRADR